MTLRVVDPPVPPNELDAEAAVISALLTDGRAIGAVRVILAPECYYAVANRLIYEAVLAIVDTGSVADLVTVAAWLRDRDRLGQVGGTPYLAQILDATPAVANVCEHAQLIVERWKRRTFVDSCRQAAIEVKNGAAVADLVPRFTADLARLVERRVAAEGILTADAIFADLPAPDYLFSPLIIRGSVNELAAYGSSGKTWIAVDAVISTGAGVPFLGRFPATVGEALYIDWENGSYELRRRLQAVARGRGLALPVAGVSLCSMPGFTMNSPDFAERIQPLAEGRSLVVIDTLRAATPGVDENDSRMRTGLDVLHRVGEQTGTAFLVLLHTKKTSANTTTIDPREAGRGSSAIFDAADTVLHVSYSEGEPLAITQTKARSGKAVLPFRVEITDTANGGVRVSATDEAPVEGQASDKFEAACQRVLDAIRDRPGHSGKVYRESLGMRHATVTAAIDRLSHDGALRNSGTKAEPKWFPTTLKGGANG